MGAERAMARGAERSAEPGAPPPPRRGLVSSRCGSRPQLRRRAHKLCGGAGLAPAPRAPGRPRPYLLAPPPAAAYSPAPGPPRAATLPRSSAASPRGSAPQAVAGAQRPGPGGRIARRAVGPALNPWGPGADDACGAARGGDARGWTPPPCAWGRWSRAPHGRPAGGDSRHSGTQKPFPRWWVASLPAQPTALDLGPLGSQFLAETLSYECPPEGVGKVDPPQVTGRCNSFSQTTNGIPLGSLPSHLLAAEVRIAPSILAPVHTQV